MSGGGQMADSDTIPAVSPTSPTAISALRTMRDRSLIRRKLLAKTLGVKSGDDLSDMLGTSSERSQSKPEPETTNPGNISDFNELLSSFTYCGPSRRESTPLGNLTVSWPECDVTGSDNLNGSQPFVVAKRLADSGTVEQKTKRRRTADQAGFESDGDETIMEPFDDYYQVLQEEEKVYRGSATFLKGTQSANPHNDYCQHFIDTGQRPQNFIRDSGLAERFDEYPKLKELIKLKDELVATTATPPMYLKCDLHTYDLRQIGSRFDVILIEPPLEEYQMIGQEGWSWDQIEQLDIPAVADTRAFLWLWCGSTPEGLQRGRNCLKRWGFRRCEDICWVKTNKSTATKESEEQQQGGVVRVGAGQLAAGNSLLQRTKEHCLMGIKGTVRRSTDGDFIHANVDIDLIITEDPSPGSIEKPLEIVLIAEHFCLGRRRLHLFGRDDTLRPGWLTIGPELTSSNFDATRYCRFFDRQPGGPGYTTGCTDRIEMLRPKSPVPMDKRSGGGGVMNHSSAANIVPRLDGGGGAAASNSWQRTSSTGDLRDRSHGGAASDPRHAHKRRQKTPPPALGHDRGADHRLRRGANNGAVANTGGRLDHFVSTRDYRSHRGSHSTSYVRGRERGSNISRAGSTRRRF